MRSPARSGVPLREAVPAPGGNYMPGFCCGSAAIFGKPES